MSQLRGSVHNVAAELPIDITVEETLKWGEPSFVTRYGSTLRMDWKSKRPDLCALSFKCTSLLVSTFKDVYGQRLNYEGSRAIVLLLGEHIPVDTLKACVGAALQYHKSKTLPLLGLA